jgi:RsiW-degrading membrane proteinase PrsW (M82 family)
LSFEPILLAPEQEVEERYPYRRVWRTSWLEVGTILVAVLAIFSMTRLFHVLPTSLHDTRLKVAVAVVPLAAWLVFSYWGERRAPQPRRGLVQMVILGGLVANGIAVPLEVHLFLPDRWLPTQSFFGRVLGYATTVGFTAEFLKYAVVRYTVWPDRIRQRLDGVAYALAASIGYAVVLNLQVALFTDDTLAATALRVASNTFSQLGIGVIMGFFLAELVVGRTPVFWLPMGLGIASLLSGAYYGFRSLTVVRSISATGSISAPLRGLALAVGLVAVLYMTFAFLIESADARMEALTGRRQAL